MKRGGSLHRERMATRGGAEPEGPEGNRTARRKSKETQSHHQRGPGTRVQIKTEQHPQLVRAPLPEKKKKGKITRTPEENREKTGLTSFATHIKNHLQRGIKRES